VQRVSDNEEFGQFPAWHQLEPGDVHPDCHCVRIMMRFESCSSSGKSVAVGIRWSLSTLHMGGSVLEEAKKQRS
jgi:hypothetical protein